MEWTVRWTKGQQRGVESRYKCGSAYLALRLWAGENPLATFGAVEAVFQTDETGAGNGATASIKEEIESAFIRSGWGRVESAPIRVEKTAYVIDPSAWRKGFVVGFVAAAALAAVAVGMLWRM